MKKTALRIYRPVPVTAAIVLFWAALNEPDSFTVADVAVWLLRAASAGLVVRAALAVAEPLVTLATRRLAQSRWQAAARTRAERQTP
jgi:hypothetical protein